MAIEILRIIEIQKNMAARCKKAWEKLLEDAARDVSDIIPGAQKTTFVLDITLNQLKEIKTFIKQYADQQDKENYDLALQYRAKLTELLNKY